LASIRPTGALLNAGSRYFDQRLGQSVTLSGRTITKHMASETNKFVTGIYDHYGEAVISGDTDSVVGSTIIKTLSGDISIEALFESCNEKWTNNDKEYAYDPELMVTSFDPVENKSYMGNIDHIYRHKVSKDLYEIEDELGNVITVTEDHSIMIERGGKLIDVKPAQILDNDIIISLSVKINLLHRGKVKSVKKITPSSDEYVYDITMSNENHPWFFGNDILVHNSTYFSVYPLVKDDVKSGNIVWTKESVIELYNNIAKEVSATFPKHLKEKLNVPVEKSTGVIASSREIVAESGIFIVKKRYAALVYEKDGIRLDIDGKPGKVKAMGLDLKRADTPKFVQEFLSEILLDTLTDKGEEYVISKIKEFKKKFEDLKPWQQGTPRAVNKLTFYKNKEESYLKNRFAGINAGSATMPGHVKASLNWNKLRELNHDQHSLRIIDGQKVIVCKLKQTPDNLMTSIAFPVDEVHLPSWFLELPFDSGEMMESVVDQKVRNLLGCLDWELDRTDKSFEKLESLFDFSAR